MQSSEAGRDAIAIWTATVILIVGVGTGIASSLSGPTESPAFAAEVEGLPPAVAGVASADTFERWGMTWWPMDRPPPVPPEPDSDAAVDGDTSEGSLSSFLERMRRALAIEAPPVVGRHPILTTTPLEFSSFEGLLLDGEGAWPTPVVQLMREFRQEFNNGPSGPRHHTLEELGSGFRMAELADGLEFYSVDLRVPTGRRHTAYAAFNPVRQTTSDLVTVGDRFAAHSGGSLHLDATIDLDGDGTAELLVGSQSRNGTVEDYQPHFYLEVGPDGTLTEVLALIQHHRMPMVSDGDAGYVRRWLHRLDPRALLVTVIFENDYSGVTPRRLGRLLLERSGRGAPYAAVGRFFYTEDAAGYVSLGF